MKLRKSKALYNNPQDLFNLFCRRDHCGLYILLLHTLTRGGDEVDESTRHLCVQHVKGTLQVLRMRFGTLILTVVAIVTAKVIGADPQRDELKK